MSFVAYPSYKDATHEWCARIPASWQLVRIKYVATLNDEDLPENYPPDLEIEYVDIGSVNGTGKIAEIERMRFEDAPSRARRIVRDGDVIISTVRTYLRAIAAIRNPPADLIVSTGFAVVRPTKIESAFLAWSLRSEEFIASVVANSQGVSYPAISSFALSSIPIPVPPSDEQHTIVVFLDRETAKVDRLIGKQEKLIALLREKRQTVITHAVTKGLNPNAPMKDSGIEWLGEVPAHWERIRLARLFRNRDQRGQTDLPILQVSIHDGVTVREFNGQHVEQRYDDLGAYKLAKKGDLSFNKMRAWQGALGFVPEDGLVSPDYTVAEPVADFSPVFLERLLRTKGYQVEIDKRSYGIVKDRNRLYWDGFKEIVVYLPDMNEQVEIDEVVSSQLERIDTMIAAAERAIERMKEHRSALISAAVTGKIDVRGLVPEQEAAE